MIDHGYDGVRTIPASISIITPSGHLNGGPNESDLLNYAPRFSPSSYFPRIKDPVILSYEASGSYNAPPATYTGCRIK
jgi:hypothetical protein